MTPTLSSKPIVIIFERHWDEAPRQIVKDLIPELAKEGYDTFCLEAPQNWTEDKIVSSHQSGLKQELGIHSLAQKCLESRGFTNTQLSDLGFQNLATLMRLFVSSQKYLEVAEKIKGLPANLLFVDIFEEATRRAFTIKGIDVDAKEFNDILPGDISERNHMIDENEPHRITTLYNNLYKLQQDGKKLIFVCGALHAENLLNTFRQQNGEDKVLYYFPHSDKSYGDNIDDVEILFSNGTLKNHTFRIINAKGRTSLVNRVITDIKSKNTHPKAENLYSASRPWTLIPYDFFQRYATVLLRPLYYVGVFLGFIRE